jgi:hypothetical protein
MTGKISPRAIGRHSANNAQKAAPAGDCGFEKTPKSYPPRETAHGDLMLTLVHFPRRPQGSDRRNRPGVTPVTRRKFVVKWLWLEKPAA